MIHFTMNPDKAKSKVLRLQYFFHLAINNVQKEKINY